MQFVTGVGRIEFLKQIYEYIMSIGSYLQNRIGKLVNRYQLSRTRRYLWLIHSRTDCLRELYFTIVERIFSTLPWCGFSPFLNGEGPRWNCPAPLDLHHLIDETVAMLSLTHYTYHNSINRILLEFWILS